MNDMHKEKMCMWKRPGNERRPEFVNSEESVLQGEQQVLWYLLAPQIKPRELIGSCESNNSWDDYNGCDVVPFKSGCTWAMTYTHPFGRVLVYCS
jgi:hypothetical protein